MKKQLLLTALLMLLFGVKMQAIQWTDDNGVTWSFAKSSFTINGESQQLYYISNVRGHGESVTIPSVVYDGTTPCTIEAIVTDNYNGSAFSTTDKTTTSITLPSTIKYIRAFQLYAGKIYINSVEPPTLAFYNGYNFSSGVTILVPEASLGAYHAAENWKDIEVRIISQNAKTDYTVSVGANSSSSGLHLAIGESNLGNVMSLKVSGSVNSYDFLIMRNKMHNLHHVDLTDCRVVSNNYEYYTGYHSVDNTITKMIFNQRKYMTIKFPKTITTIAEGAFTSNYGLREVVCQGNLEIIDSYAFEDCFNFKSITLNEGLKTISTRAFSGCSALVSVDTPESLTSIGSRAFVSSGVKQIQLKHNLRSLGSEAFAYCPLESITLPEGLTTVSASTFYYCRSLTNVVLPSTIKTIETAAFASCSALTAITLPEHLTTINNSAFKSCSALISISLPERVKTIGDGAFSGCSALTEIHLPSSVQSIGGDAFSSCPALLNVYAYTIEPTNIAQNTFSTWTTATLHVPTLAYYNYYYDTQWSQFAHLVEDNNYAYNYFYFNHDFVFNDTNYDDSTTPDADLNGGSGLIVETTNSTVALGDVHLQDNGTTAASIVANNNLTVENLFFDMEVAANKWYFLSLPFRVKQTNVTTPGDYVFRYYDGAARAANGNGGWKNHTGEYLEAHTGYIFQTNTAGTLTFQVEPGDVSFSGATRSDAMAENASQNPKNASWNFMGNPFPSYYDIDNTGFNAPITVWNGSSYTAVRPGDDQYHLGPFQAFFVQKPTNQTQISFPNSGCHTLQQWPSIVAGKTNTNANAPLHAAQNNRKLVNLTIGSDETVDDRTRVVFNEQKSTGYELDCDAAKFFSSEQVAQLYSLDEEQTSYAINERPMGEVSLGYVAVQDGMLTIAAERMDQPVLLYDKLMNIKHDLSTGGYTFNTASGTFHDRFMLTVDGSATAITDNVLKDQQPTDVYSLDGKHVSTNGTDGLSSGTYVVKQGNVSTKVIVK